ncbi:hypothetical protein R75465_07751 [Paraburkholderia aspalathi]|nr:hypothetical protein R75465_07751 [Paraburkholderia aspalathi]
MTQKRILLRNRGSCRYTFPDHILSDQRREIVNTNNSSASKARIIPAGKHSILLDWRALCKKWKQLGEHVKSRQPKLLFEAKLAFFPGVRVQ